MGQLFFVLRCFIIHEWQNECSQEVVFMSERVISSSKQIGHSHCAASSASVSVHNRRASIKLLNIGVTSLNGMKSSSSSSIISSSFGMTVPSGK